MIITIALGVTLGLFLTCLIARAITDARDARLHRQIQRQWRQYQLRQPLDFGWRQITHRGEPYKDDAGRWTQEVSMACGHTLRFHDRRDGPGSMTMFICKQCIGGRDALTP